MTNTTPTRTHRIARLVAVGIFALAAAGATLSQAVSTQAGRTSVHNSNDRGDTIVAGRKAGEGQKDF